MAGSDENGRPVQAEEIEDQAHETGEQPVLDPETQARRERALALIRTFGDPALRASAVDVTRFDEALHEEIARMEALMGDALGLGLAATQLGVMHRLFVFRVGSEAPLVAVVNPRLEWSSQDQETAEEGCLSLPRVLVDVERPLHVRVSAQDARGEPIVLEASGLEARVIQHEMDHLDGVLILDRTTKDQRKEALRALRGGTEQHSHEPSASARSAG
ncbi:MAG TPA: peptide deformylase [Solirubrobacterales bacterium]|nr:peptide deformylase [Solirubrobacterales bacterium]